MLFMKGSLLHRFDVLLFHSSCLHHVSFSFLVFFCVLSQRIGHNCFRLSLCKRQTAYGIFESAESVSEERDRRVADWAAPPALQKWAHQSPSVLATGSHQQRWPRFTIKTVVTADCQGAFAALRKPVELIWKLKGDCTEEKTRPPPAAPSLPPHRTPRHFRLYSRHMFNY